MKTVEFRCMCGKTASVTYTDDDTIDVALAHTLPTCKDFDVVTNATNGADYIRNCRLSLVRQMN